MTVPRQESHVPVSLTQQLPPFEPPLLELSCHKRADVPEASSAPSRPPGLQLEHEASAGCGGCGWLPGPSSSIALQGPGPDLRLRKASDQPSGHSQVTESSGSTPESCPELSEEDEDGDLVPGSKSVCPRCGKEARRLQALHEAVLSIREAQQELHRHLSAMLSSSVRPRQAPAPGLMQSPRSWFLLCVFLTCQLLINSILT